MELPNIPPLQDGHDPTVIRYVSNPKIAQQYDAAFADSQLFNTDTKFLDDVLPPAPAEVVDLGCGTGRHLIHLARLGYTLTGVDASSHMLDIVRKKLENESQTATLAELDICELARYDDASFDVAICMFSTLGLIRTRHMRRRAVMEAVRVLRPGGLYVCHTHNKWFPTSFSGGWQTVLLNWLASLAGRGEFGDQLMSNYRGLQDLYLHSFSLSELRSLLISCGLTPARVMPLNAARTGECTSRFAWRVANGFLVAATKQ